MGDFEVHATQHALDALAIPEDLSRYRCFSLAGLERLGSPPKMEQ